MLQTEPEEVEVGGPGLFLWYPSPDSTWSGHYRSANAVKEEEFRSYGPATLQMFFYKGDIPQSRNNLDKLHGTNGVPVYESAIRPQSVSPRKVRAEICLQPFKKTCYIFVALLWHKLVVPGGDIRQTEKQHCLQIVPPGVPPGQLETCGYVAPKKTKTFEECDFWLEGGRLLKHFALCKPLGNRAMEKCQTSIRIELDKAEGLTLELPQDDFFDSVRFSRSFLLEVWRCSVTLADRPEQEEMQTYSGATQSGHSGLEPEYLHCLAP